MAGSRFGIGSWRAVLDIGAAIAMIAASIVLIWTSLQGSSPPRREVAEPPIPAEPVSLEGAALRGDRSARWD